MYVVNIYLWKQTSILTVFNKILDESNLDSSFYIFTIMKIVYCFDLIQKVIN